jgi:Flp pilus assembly pilin Flp
MKFSLRRRRGQGMTEYIIIVGLIAILLITAVETYKNKLDQTFSKASGTIDNKVTSQIGK